MRASREDLETRMEEVRAALGGRSKGLDRDAAGGEMEVWFVPGRIEVLGKHTDYAGGRSLVAATRQGLCLAFRPRQDALLRVEDLTSDLRAECQVAADLEPAGQWVNYLHTVARRLASNFPGGLRGADVVFTSDLPRSAGMSSSSALVVAIYLVLARVNRLAARAEYRRTIGSRENLGEYLGAIENGLDFGELLGQAGVGTFGGSEDQTAILCSQAGRLRQYSYCPVRLEREIDVPDGYEFAVAVSGVKASKTGNAREAYNQASRLASCAAQAWRQGTGGEEPHLAAVLATGATIEDVETVLLGEKVEGFSGEELARRFRHFALESEELVIAAGNSLVAGDLLGFGAAVDRSQRSVEELLDNQIPETVFLARSARRLSAIAASAFGAGFGGSVWALIEAESRAEFLESWAGLYSEAFPERRKARFTSTLPSQGARRLDDPDNTSL